MTGLDFFKIVLENIGIAKRNNKPEKINCPYCGSRAVYLWKHAINKDCYVAIGCVACETVGLTLSYDKEKIIKMFKGDKING